MMELRKIAALTVASAAFTSIALAADGAAETPPAGTNSAFQLTFTLDAWFPRLVGNAPLGAGGSSVDVTALDLHDSEVSFFGAARASWDRWFVEVGGFDFETEGSSPTQAGFASASASWWSASVTAGFALWRPFDDQPCPWSTTAPRAGNRAPDGEQRLSLAFSPTVGVAWDQIEIDTVASGSGVHSGIDGGWGSARFGIEVTLDLHTKDLLTVIDSVEIYVDGSVGPTFGIDGAGDGIGSVWWVDAGMRVFFTPNIAGHLGYRLVDGKFADDSANTSEDLGVGLQGLVAGVVIRF